MVCLIFSSSNGFARCAFIPASIHFSASSLNAFAVIAMIGIVFASCRSRDLIVFVAVSPSITGIMTSIKITSYVPDSQASKCWTASNPFFTVSTLAPFSVSINSAISAFSSLSSTNNIRTPDISALKSSFSSGRAFVSILNGSITVKQLPSPSLLSTVMVPPIFSTSCFTIGIPRPVPL